MYQQLKASIYYIKIIIKLVIFIYEYYKYEIIQ